MESIHSRLKKFRQRAGLTIQEVSKVTGIPASTYKEWENGRQIRGEPYAVLAETYQVSLQELITGQKSKSSSLLAKFDGVEAEIQNIKKDLIALL
ncbi:helix-turn-helix domain-containing protein [Bdellovibrio sp. HCB337]|uniref:helix-turn-helix domain-containing protein n=1 Tax=Bdellovibrio sp. HCB337 TaxID=3394358 RepID=UPI0039A4B1AD